MKRMLFALAVPTVIATGALMPTSAYAALGDLVETQFNGVIPTQVEDDPVVCNPAAFTWYKVPGSTSQELENGTDAAGTWRGFNASGVQTWNTTLPALAPGEHTWGSATFSNYVAAPAPLLPNC